MEIEKQVCSLELAKRLKELGVKQDGYFSWTEQEGYIGLEHWELRRAASGAHTISSAFTVAELGEMLKEKTRPIFNTSSQSWIWSPAIRVKYSVKEKTEADARAKTLLYFIENGLIKP